MGTYYELLLGEELDPRSRRCEAKRDARAAHRRAVPGRADGRRGRGALRPGPQAAPGRPTTSRRSRSRPAHGQRQVHLPALLADALRESRAARRAGCSARAGCARRRAARGRTSSTSTLERLDGAVLQVGRRKFRRLRLGLGLSGRLPPPPLYSRGRAGPGSRFKALGALKGRQNRWLYSLVASRWAPEGAEDSRRRRRLPNCRQRAVRLVGLSGERPFLWPRTAIG